MKKVFLIIFSLSILLLFSGCCLSHEWVEASCTAPKTCSKCEKTEGEPLEHQWKEATCIEPKTCTSCAATEGEKLEHTFGKEEILDPNYVEATATFVKTCTNCGEQTERKGELEKLHDGKVFLMTPEEFSARFTEKLMAMQHLLGNDQYLSFIDTETKIGNLKMYMCQRNTSGTIKVVGEFEMSVYGSKNQMMPEQHNEAGVFWKVHGTVKGEDPKALAMVALVRTVDPTRDEDTTAIKTLSGWQDTPLVDEKGVHYMQFGDFIVGITPKGSTTDIYFEIR